MSPVIRALCASLAVAFTASSAWACLHSPSGAGAVEIDQAEYRKRLAKALTLVAEWRP